MVKHERSQCFDEIIIVLPRTKVKKRRNVRNVVRAGRNCVNAWTDCIKSDRMYETTETFSGLPLLTMTVCGER